MGRGRAKAKQTRVARELKYSSPSTDLTALQRELGGHGSTYPTTVGKDDTEDDGDDIAGRWVDDEPDDGWVASR